MTDPVVEPSAKPPASALLLGYAGLLPPIIAIIIAIGMRLADPPLGPPLGQFLLILTVIYAALILSFLGGIWWGVAAARVTGAGLGLWLGFAVLPSLVALIAAATFLLSATAGAAFLAAGLLSSLLVDMALVRAGHVPPWWMKLRVPLSVGLAILMLVAGLLFEPIVNTH